MYEKKCVCVQMWIFGFYIECQVWPTPCSSQIITLSSWLIDLKGKLFFLINSHKNRVIKFKFVLYPFLKFFKASCIIFIVSIESFW